MDTFTRFLFQINLLTLLVLTSALGCTREIKNETSKIKISLPNASQATMAALKSKRQSVQSQSTNGWNGNDPADLAEIGCYAVFVGSAGAELSSQSCTSSSNGTLKFGPFAGFVPASGTVELGVPSGLARSIHLIGIKGSGACPPLGTQISKHQWSKPMLLGTTTIDLKPGDVTAEITAALSNDRLDDCTNMTFANVSSTISFVSASPSPVVPRVFGSSPVNSLGPTIQPYRSSSLADFPPLPIKENF